MTKVQKDSKVLKECAAKLACIEQRYPNAIDSGVIVDVLSHSRLLNTPDFAYGNSPWMALDVSTFVDAKSAIDFDMLSHYAALAQRLLDDAVDLQLEAIDEVLSLIESDNLDEDAKTSERQLWISRRTACASERRTSLCLCGVDKVLSQAVEAQRIVALAAYSSSVQLARERGVCKGWNAQSGVNAIPDDDMQFAERRNATCLAAPIDACRGAAARVQTAMLAWVDSSQPDTSARGSVEERPLDVIEKRPDVLECDVVRFQNNKEKWVAFVGLLDGRPYEIFTGIQDEDEGIVLPKSVTKGRIIKQLNRDGTKRYDFQFQNKRGYKTTVEGLSEKFNPEYWNYAKLLSGVLRYRMPLDHVIRLVGQLSLTDDNINTWKNGVERALKKYIQDDSAERDILSSSDEASNTETE